MSRLLVLPALISILTAHFILPGDLLIFSMLVFAFTLVNFLRQANAANDTTSVWLHPRIEQAIWWAVVAALSYRLVVLIFEYFDP